MKFGTKIKFCRGSGFSRTVEGIYVGARGNDVRIKLLHDAPESCLEGMNKKGDIGWWAKSSIIKGEVE